ncbi:helix-turn-helix domain-containing protein [Galbitalea sp. SE-J8]|uniref:helix-turn-helix transcriptional regulator n=1 Tax=Galbitalea sp. SE-J8 TaxID=3054952 RepID=UPI00259D1501|nr:helix-turn-helix domain-containing protein [Galbitalea sp. SE-J8]MDM4761928.1 helix-turn-helix domain-containing protein [Galbitalea sp. SE-J8]
MPDVLGRERTVRRVRGARGGGVMASKLLTIDDLAEQLGVKPKTIYAARSDGRHDQFPPAIKVGSFLRWRQQDVDGWLEAQLPQTNVLPMRKRIAG